MGKQNRNPYKQVQTHEYERQGNSRRAMRNQVRWRNKRVTGRFDGKGVDNARSIR